MAQIIKVQKRPLLLLEIMIALALISLCMLPLLAPRAEMVKEQQAFIGKMELDHDVNLLYCDVLERLQKNEIPLRDILEHTPFPIDQAMLQRQGLSQLPLALTGTYRFDDAPKPNHKVNETSGWSTYRFFLTFVFTPESTDSKYIFQYRVFLAHHGLGTAEPASEPDQAAPEEKQDDDED